VKKQPGLYQPYRPGIEWMFPHRVLPRGINRKRKLLSRFIFHRRHMGSVWDEDQLQACNQGSRPLRRLSSSIAQRSTSSIHRSVPAIEHLTLVWNDYRRCTEAIQEVWRLRQWISCGQWDFPVGKRGKECV